MSENNGGSRPRRRRAGPKRAPWERWLTEPATIVDKDEAERRRPTFEALLAALGDLPECWYGCLHVMARAAAGQFIVGFSCREHAQLRCADCHRAHIDDVEVPHDRGCAVPDCPQAAVGAGELVVFFDQVPLENPEAAVTVKHAFGGRSIAGLLCSEHGAGRRWHWDEIIEPQAGAS